MISYKHMQPVCPSLRVLSDTSSNASEGVHRVHEPNRCEISTCGGMGKLPLPQMRLIVSTRISPARGEPASRQPRVEIERLLSSLSFHALRKDKGLMSAASRRCPDSLHLCDAFLRSPEQCLSVQTVLWMLQMRPGQSPSAHTKTRPTARHPLSGGEGSYTGFWGLESSPTPGTHTLPHFILTPPGFHHVFGRQFDHDPLRRNRRQWWYHDAATASPSFSGL